MKLTLIAALAYAILFVINYFLGNEATLLIQSILGVGLFLLLAVEAEMIKDQTTEHLEKMQTEIDALKKQIKNM